MGPTIHDIQRQERIAANQAKFASLDIQQAVDNLKAGVKSSKKPTKARAVKVLGLPPSRTSTRVKQRPSMADVSLSPERPHSSGGGSSGTSTGSALLARCDETRRAAAEGAVGSVGDEAEDSAEFDVSASFKPSKSALLAMRCDVNSIACLPGCLCSSL